MDLEVASQRGVAQEPLAADDARQRLGVVGPVHCHVALEEKSLTIKDLGTNLSPYTLLPNACVGLYTQAGFFASLLSTRFPPAVLSATNFCTGWLLNWS